jgi:uncharacterized protein (TIGR03118 family)
MQKQKAFSIEKLIFLAFLTLISTGCNATGTVTISPAPTMTPVPTSLPTISPTATPVPTPISTATPQTTFQQVNLVGDTNEHQVIYVDQSLKNGWGIAMSPSGNFWVSSEGGGVSTIYNKDGLTVLTPVNIPSNTGSTGGHPTGVIYNSTQDFVISSNSEVSKFIFAGGDGTVSAWSSGTGAIKVIDKDIENTSYTGIATGKFAENNYIYLANFKGKKIEAFDKNFNFMSNLTFVDQGIPGDYGPFNIQNIGGNLYVTYAKLKAPENEDEQKGAGFGYVDVFNTDGSFIRRLATQGSLNAPWAVVKAPAGFGKFANNILVGNFGDGSISVFDDVGNFKGQLMDKDNHTIRIDGLWGLTFIENSTTSDANRLYFTSGPADELHGMFGYLN